MELDERGVTDFYHFPVEETDKAMADMTEAIKTDNLAALKRSAGLLVWLYRAFKDDTCGSDEPFEFESCEFSSVQQFNAAWKNEVKKTAGKTK